MNPQLILILIIILGSKNKAVKTLPAFRLPQPPKAPAYIDTFKMEMTLDRLKEITKAIETINQLNQKQKVPTPSKKSPPPIDNIHQSLDAIKGLLSDGGSTKQVDSLSNAISGLKKMGNLDEVISVMGPIMSMLSGD
jgi:hypothetical protein